MDANSEKTAKPRRHWLRFSLRTLLIVVAILSVPLGWVGWELKRVRSEQEEIAWIEGMGGGVSGVPFYIKDPEISWWVKLAEDVFGERVRWVILRGTPVSDLSPLAELKNLEELLLSHTQVSDLSPLAKLKSVELLSLDNTQVGDLSPLANLNSLRLLNLANTQVSDLSPLAELKNLEGLNLQNTQVSDLSPLAELKSLRTLFLRDTQVSEEQVQELKQALPNCEMITE